MKHVKVFPILLSALVFSGCWDKVEIDRRTLISTIGIDSGKDIKKEDELKKIKPDEPYGERVIERLNIVYGFPDISKYSAESKQIPEDKTIKVESYSMEDAFYKASAKSSRSLQVDHARLLVFSSDVFAYPEIIKENIDYISRNPRLNRMMNVVVAQGKAEEMIKYKPNTENNIENFISGLMENSGRNAAIIPVSLNQILTLLSQNGNAIVPSMKLDKEKNELKLTGVAIIKDYSLKGYLSPSETSILMMLRGRLKSGKKVIFMDGHPIDYEIDGMKRKIKFSRTDGKLFFNIDLDLEGKIKEYYTDDTVFGREKLDQIQHNFNISISQECEKLVRLTQREFGVDPIGFREYLEKYHPNVWDEVKDKWGDVYKDAVVTVGVDTRVRRIGIKK